MRILKVEIVLIFLLLSSYVPLASADEIHATSYSDTIDSHPHGRKSNSFLMRLIATTLQQRSSKQTDVTVSATCTSGQTFIILDIEIQMSSNTTRADVRWNGTPDGSTPVDSRPFQSSIIQVQIGLQVEDTVVSTTVRV